MARLSVNVNKVATLRNARGGVRPSVVQAAEIALDAGAYGITVHPRPDERHIRRSDVRDLARLTRTRGVELNLEGYPSPELLALVEEVRPAQCTLVPDPPDVLTSNAGWRLAQAPWLDEVLARLRGWGVRSSLFVETDLQSVPAIAAAIARVESRVAGQGRLLVRYSGTEPLLRVMLEGKHQDDIRGWAQEIVDVVKQHLG